MKCDTENSKYSSIKCSIKVFTLRLLLLKQAFMSLAHTNEDIEKTLAAADIAFAAVA